MSDLDDDLLALVGDAPEPSRLKVKRSASPSQGVTAPAAKKRKRAKDAGSGSDMDMDDSSAEEEKDEEEAAPYSPPAPASAPVSKRAAPAVAYDTDDEEEDDDAGEEDEDDSDVSPDALYPLEGLYKDKADRRELLDMNELDREAVLGTRQEEIQKRRDRLQVKQLLRDRDSGGASKRGARTKTTTGKTALKADKLAELRKKRATRAKRAAQADSEDEEDARPRRARSYSSASDVYSEDERRTTRGRRRKEPVERAGREDITNLVLPRWRLAQSCFNGFFEKFVTHAWVRVSLGPNKQTGQLVYNLAEIIGLGPRERDPYPLEGTPVMTDLTLLLRHGKSERVFRMDQISDAPMQPAEYSKLLNTLQQEEVELPTKRDYEAKRAVIQQYKDKALDEAELTQTLKNKADFKTRHRYSLQRHDLQTRRRAARQTGDTATVQSIDADLQALAVEVSNAKAAASAAAEAKRAVEANGDSTNGHSGEVPKPPAPTLATVPPPSRPADAKRDALALVNERNRKANREEVRKAELAANARAAKAGSDGRIDPSARVRTQVRLLHDASAGPVSLEGSRAGTPGPESQQSGATTTGRSTPLKVNAGAGTGARLDQQIASRVTVDLGDF